MFIVPIMIGFLFYQGTFTIEVLTILLLFSLLYSFSRNIYFFDIKFFTFRNINFKINRGQIFGMLGPNGVGKSTIFNLITGLINPQHGKIIINGEDVTKYPIYLRTKKFKVGYVPQYGGYFNDLTLFDNMKAIGEIVIDNK